MAGIYAYDTHMDYIIGYNGVTEVIYAFNLSNPSQAPTVAWTYVASGGGSELLCYGNGELFVGGDAYRVYALNGTSGALLWTSVKQGYGGQMGVYEATSSTDGLVYVAADSTILTCYDAVNGSALWSYNAGGRAFFSYSGTAAYGRYYQHNDQNIPSGYFACWSQQTGQMLWQQPADYEIGYLAPVSADGKIFVSTSDGVGTTNQTAQPATFTCFDAFSGQPLWSLPLNIAFPAIAYGNVYGIASSGIIYCISSPQDWSMWHGNTNNPGVGLSATTNLSYPTWTYQTGGAITSSPAVAAGEVYIGSHDTNIYCLDAYTGNKIWNYSIGTPVLSSPAVYNGCVFTGADDGYIHCLNATTGTQIWQTYAGGTIPIVFAPTWQPRSSPIIVNGELYVGALDGNVYCISTSTGAIIWNYTTGDPIGGSATYSQGTIYIASTDSYIYAFNATNGNIIWTTQTPDLVKTAGFNLYLVGSPVVAGGRLFIGGGGGGSSFLAVGVFIALNTTNGRLLWSTNLLASTWPVFTPTYANSTVFIDSGLYSVCLNATSGATIWKQFLGFETTSSPAYANAITSPTSGSSATIYVGSDVGSLQCLNASTGAPVSVYTTGSQMPSSPTIWEGKVYVGGTDGVVYSFGGAPLENTSLVESLNTNQINTGETVTATGQMIPGLPNATVTVTFTGPNGSTNVTTITDNYGAFCAAYTPNTAGNWTATASYGGQAYACYAYKTTSSNVLPLTVQGPIVAQTPTPTKAPNNQIFTPTIELLIAVIAIVVIAVVAVTAVMLRKRKSLKKQ